MINIQGEITETNYSLMIYGIDGNPPKNTYMFQAGNEIKCAFFKIENLTKYKLIFNILKGMKPNGSSISCIRQKTNINFVNDMLQRTI